MWFGLMWLRIGSVSELLSTNLQLSEGGYESDSSFAYFVRHVLVEEI
jgi:hypothetical protein